MTREFWSPSQQFSVYVAGLDHRVDKVVRLQKE